MGISQDTGLARAEEAGLQRRFERALLALDRQGARRLIEQALVGRPAVAVVEALVSPALERIGQAWEAGTVALSQVYMAGRLCEELVEAVLPEIDRGREASSPLAMATLDDYHLLGKRIVLTALRASGYAVRDYGRGTPGEVVDRALADGIEVLLLSTLMLPAALRVRDVRSLLARHGSRMNLVVGGAPFRLDARLATEVGADAVGTNTAEAIAIVRRLSGRQP